jgi:hypothetical protein
MGCMQSKPALVSGVSSNTRGKEQICAVSSLRGVGSSVESSNTQRQEQIICTKNSPRGVAGSSIESSDDATYLLKLEAAIEAENWQAVGAAAQKMSDSRISVVDHSRNELPVYVPFSVPPYARSSPGGMSSAIRDGGGGSGGGCDSRGGGAVGSCGGGGGGGCGGGGCGG